ncbi:MAG: U32 family peptidase [Oscillospiraceae bacterium]|nr:U32 family peptidase [Oscillospiraceae bacterium]
MLEIVSPAGSPEAVIAAVQNGADAVCLGFSELNADKNAANFTRDEFGRALEYCRVRGVRTYLTLDTLAYNRELSEAAELAKEACRLGVDAVVVQDLGVLMAIRKSAPDVPVYAGEQMCIHNVEGVKMAAALGMKRVIVSRELSRRKLAYICRNSPIDIEVFVHGSSCISYSGQCYLSSLTANGSDHRGECARPCREIYNTGGHDAGRPLSLKDHCLARYMTDLEVIGVAAVRIEGREERSEYAAIVTGVYSKATRSGKMPAQEEIAAMRKAFSRHGFTDGYYTEKLGVDMLAEELDIEKDDSIIFSTARRNYLNGEFQRVPVRFVGTVSEGKRVKLAAEDDRKNSAVVYGPLPDTAFHKELSVAALQTQLHKTSGTPFICAGVKGTVEPGLSLSISAFNDMRRNLLSEILDQRKIVPDRAEGEFTPDSSPAGREELPILTVSVMRADQLSAEMEQLRPKIVYIPVLELDFDLPAVRDFAQNEDITVVAALPQIIHDNERKRVSEALSRAVEHNVTEALVGNLGHVLFAAGHGMDVRGDSGLNVFNSETLRVLRDLRMKSAVLSVELSLAEIRDMPKPLDTELIVYGRQPLMITENCIVRNITGVCTCENFSGLTDSGGSVYPIVPDFGCRNVVLHAKKLFMANRRRATSGVGLWAERLSFTTENAIECAAVLRRYMGEGDYEPSGYTRGALFKTV